MKTITTTLLLICTIALCAQDYFTAKYGPYDADIPSPESFLGYDVGDYHTRHDRIVSYMEALAEASDRASLIDYGRSHEQRRLVILQISNPAHIQNLANIQATQQSLVDPRQDMDLSQLADHPVLVNLGYNVHGNEPSSSEAAMLTAYVLIASQHPDIGQMRDESVVFIDPVINPDGRDRHTQWANSHRSQVLSADPMDSEHNEMWPRGRTNHYWFDLNRDWLLAVHPESQGKLAWYHQWYPNVVTDFHEMGSNSTYFFEPMKTNGSGNPIMPVENYTTLNDLFAEYYHNAMDEVGTLYFTKEVFDGTYPGYGSSYPDLQGGLGILFEQASSRGHLQDNDFGQISFAYTIRNQFINSLATVEAAVENKSTLFQYQRDFFTSAMDNARKSGIRSYIFKEEDDDGRKRAFVDLLLKHQVVVQPLQEEVYMDGLLFRPENSYIVPTEQAQYRMVQTMFETYSDFQDSVFYDASAWSLANAYNMEYKAVRRNLPAGDALTPTDLITDGASVTEAEYAYILPWADYHAPAALYHLHDKGVKVMATQKAFTLQHSGGENPFGPGTLVVPLQIQELTAVEIKEVMDEVSAKYSLPVYSTHTGYASSGIDLGSRFARVLESPKTALLIGNGISSYEAGFVWHLLDQRVSMPLTKIQMHQFGRADLDKYNVMVLVSGSYASLDSTAVQRLKSWVERGNTLITIGRATAWAIRQKLVVESLVQPAKKKEGEKEEMVRYDYDQAGEIQGREAVGGAIFEVDLDITHPIGYGYTRRSLPVYRNNTVWLQPSKNHYANIALYADDPHIDGFITEKNLEENLKGSASVIASRVGSGRAILFADDPNFRGTWYGTNKLFLNAVFFGQLVRVP